MTWPFLAGAGWAVALIALFLAVRFRADWADIWRTAWVLRHQGWTTPGEMESVLTDQVAHRGRPRPQPQRPRAPIDQIVLPDQVLRVIAQSSEDWHQEELAQTAREMFAGGASELEVVNSLQQLLPETGGT